MSTKMFSKFLNIGRREENQQAGHRYTRMEVNEHGPGIEPSFQEPISQGTRSAIYSQHWPNFSIEEEYKSHYAPSTNVTTNPLYPSQQTPPFLTRLKCLFTTFPFRDMSFLTGFTFTLGSAVFVANGFFLLLPLVAPGTDFGTETPYATPASSVVGTVIFLVGGWVAVLEALNLKRGDISVIEVIESMSLEEGSAFSSSTTLVPKKDSVEEPKDSEEDEKSSPFETLNTVSLDDEEKANPISIPTTTPALWGSDAFIQLPTIQQLRTTYKADLTFHSALIQYIGAIIFSFATLTSLPGILSTSSKLQIQLLNLFPASLGGFLFLVASLLQCVVAGQINKKEGKRGWRTFGREDFWVGFWNVVGSLGFLLAGVLPFGGGETWVYWGVVADFWGSWAFLVGSLGQWWGSLGGYC